jgi:hypothetical protein
MKMKTGTKKKTSKRKNGRNMNVRLNTLFFLYLAF